MLNLSIFKSNKHHRQGQSTSNGEISSNNIAYSNEPPSYSEATRNGIYKTIIEKLKPIQYDIIDTECFHWYINKWSSLDNQSTGPIMKAGGRSWNILLFPNGNGDKGERHVSVYLNLADANINPNEHICAQFALCISNPSIPSKHVIQQAHHRFNNNEPDWGFTCFLPIKDLLHGPDALIKNNKVRITTVIRIVKDTSGILWYRDLKNYESKKATGYVGLKNLGATSYMNVVLQYFYFISSFRKAVYRIPTKKDDPTKSIPLALQKIFYNLQFSDESVDTNDLTKSFGWNVESLFIQRSAQEFIKVLQSQIEDKIKNTFVDGTIQNLFAIKTRTYIKYLNFNYESSSSQKNYEIELNIIGFKDLQESLNVYTSEKLLTGQTDSDVLQRVKKRTIFESLPPVLQINLRCFEYDAIWDTMKKINHRYEYPSEIDLEPYLDESADRSKSYIYKLHFVQVHNGAIQGGSNYIYIKPGKEDEWFKFSDYIVSKTTLSEIFEDTYGGKPLNNGQNTIGSGITATMLVYLRECMLDEILAPITEQDIPKHIVQETICHNLDTSLNIEFLIVHDEAFKNHMGFDIANYDERSDSSNHAISLSINRNQTFNDFKQQVARKIGLGFSQFRFWEMVGRQNKTIRIDKIFQPERYDLSLDELFQFNYFFKENRRIIFYLERANRYNRLGSHLLPLSSTILIFIKLFIPEQQKIHGIGQVYARKGAKIRTMINKLKQMAKIPEDREILIYEEVHPTMIDKLNINNTFDEAELINGDILCIQKKLSPLQEQIISNSIGSPTVDRFLINMHETIR